jgi:tetratricopeptide (TPR) repeat protein
MLLNYWGANVKVADIETLIFTPGREGSLQLDLVTAARRLGFLAYKLEPRLDDAFEELQAGNPVIIFQNLGLSWFPVWHYAVLIGYDLDSEKVFLRSGENARQELSLTPFLYTWGRSNNWALVVVPAGKVPITASNTEYFEAAVGLERVKRWPEAQIAYAEGYRRWPNDINLMLAYANSLYRSGELAAAERVLEAGQSAEPGSAVILNNYAHILATRGELSKALLFSSKASAIDSPYRDICERTRQEIEARIAAAKKP